MMLNMISMSGGKDSTALALLALEQGAENCRFVFADTGHEHAATYEYLDYLRSELSIEIEVVKADFTERMKTRRDNLQAKWSADDVSQEKIDRAYAALQPSGNPFLDLCLLKGRFPSTRARFCSQELKHLPILELTNGWMAEGHHITSWQGVRAEESPVRAKLPEREIMERFNHESGGQLDIYRPILNWSWQDVFDMHDKHGIKPNPLYTQGMGRVGCMPCIHSRKDELKQIGQRFPKEIARVAEWELLVKQSSKRDASSFFAADRTPKGRDLNAVSDGVVPMPLITEVIEWAKTGKGGRMRDLFDEQEPELCSSVYGLCE
jgi:3'-phosphoadenosine 5'-phosphosulfate sulfotransferase (PAPS reductase)/FAD synthetase